MFLVCSPRFGFARAASVAIAFVMAENEKMTFEEAVDHVSVRRPVLPHRGLKDAIHRLYPRPWSAPHRPPLPIRHASTTNLHMSAENWVCRRVQPDVDMFAVQYRIYAQTHATRITDADLFAVQYRIYADVVSKLIAIDDDLFVVQYRLYAIIHSDLIRDDDLFTVQYRLYASMHGWQYPEDDDLYVVQYKLLSTLY